uniref:Uncharacterized protein n=1 Tax=Calcidiscus leptoporus TaxID=127549 RepID=A0A7S0IRF0_9EUKA
MAVYNGFMPLALSVLPTTAVPTEHMPVYSGTAQAVPAAEVKRSLLFTSLPLPVSNGTTCTCKTPDEVAPGNGFNYGTKTPDEAAPRNGFKCTDGTERYCATDELCATSEEFFKDDKWSGCEKIVCTCTDPLKEEKTFTPHGLKKANEFTCTDDETRSCGDDEACVATEPFPSGKMSGTWSGCKECPFEEYEDPYVGRRLQAPGEYHCYPDK